GSIRWRCTWARGWAELRLADFEALVRRQTAEIPVEFLEGIVEIVVSPRTVPHPDRADIWTLGECIPIPLDDGDPHNLQSRVVLYHGSFQALAGGSEEFDWTGEAWETLTHEIRHHVEWRARVPDLEELDVAAEANFARQDGQPFDPAFYRGGIRLADDRYQVDDDVFIERRLSSVPPRLTFRWQGADYETSLPSAASLPAFLTVDGVHEPPPGELILVLQRKGGWLGLFQRPAVFAGTVEAVLWKR
ncbi:MAG TPA: metallopeptidase family protein, partial [Gemmatimonadales bacterium]|nr:metallopeptidase family protein [Gemmatimonadales bacterium]